MSFITLICKECFGLFAWPNSVVDISGYGSQNNRNLHNRIHTLSPIPSPLHGGVD